MGLSCTLVVLSTVAVFHLVKASHAGIAAVSLRIAATVGLSCDRHGTGDWRDHVLWEILLRV